MNDAVRRAKILELLRAQETVARLTAELAALDGVETGTRRMGRNALTGEDAARMLRQMRGVSRRQK